MRVSKLFQAHKEEIENQVNQNVAALALSGSKPSFNVASVCGLASSKARSRAADGSRRDYGHLWMHARDERAFRKGEAGGAR
jgi:hypothetical protein